METKAGYKTTEFWLKVGVSLLMTFLSTFNLAEAQFPPAVNGVLAVLIPILLAWLATKYGTDRRVLKLSAKVAGSEAAKVVTSDAAAVASLRKPQ